MSGTPPPGDPGVNPGQDQPPVPTPGGSGRSRSSALLLVVTGVAGFAAGALLLGAIWLGTSLVNGSGSGASADVDASCQILDRLPTLTREDLGTAYLSRVTAAAELASAAAEDDKRYQRLATGTKAIQQAVVTFDLDGANKKIHASRDECDAL